MKKKQVFNSRRKFLKFTSMVGLALPFTSVVNAKMSHNTFVIPPLHNGIRKGKNIAFNLGVDFGTTSFFRGTNTPTVGFNQSYLGPVLRAKRGDNVSILVNNGLNEATTVHWHGMTLPAKMDGGPHQSIQPGGSWKSEFKIRQEAATLWYHSHAMHKTGFQVYHGLAGLFIIDDEGSEKLGLPDEYGIDDIPCTIQDRRFNQDGTLSYLTNMPDHMMGMKGSTMLVNGVVTPTLLAKRTLIRLRLHNGSNARNYKLAFSDGRPFHIVAGDCGFLHKPFPTNQVRLAPAERVEILLDISDRKQVTLKTLAFSGSGNMMPMMRMMSSNPEMDIMTIDARQATQSIKKIPTKLRNSLFTMNPRNAVTLRHFDLEMGMMGRGGMGSMMKNGGPMGMMRNPGEGMFRINGRSMDINRIDFQVKANSTEIWEIRNTSPMAHPFHVHNVQFRILSRNGKRTHPSESGLKDVVLVQSNENVRIIMKFPEFSDSQTPYMYHCHILEHEDQGMMGQFVVV